MQVGVFNLTEITTLWKDVSNSIDEVGYRISLQENGYSTKIIEVVQEKNYRNNTIRYQRVGKITQEHPEFDGYYLKFFQAEDQGNQQDHEALTSYEGNNRTPEKIVQIKGGGRKTWLLLHTEQWTELHPNEIRFAYLNRKLKQEIKKIEHQIGTLIYRLGTPERLKYAVSEIQNSLLNEAMELIAINNEGIPIASELIKTDYNQKDLEVLTLFYLNQVILKVKRKYGHHFNEEVNACLQTYTTSNQELRNKITFLTKELSHWEDLNLAQIIQSQIQVVEDFIKGDFISMNEFTYAKTIVNELILKGYRKEDKEWDLTKIRFTLLYINFNHLDFIAWVTNRFKNEMNKIQNPIELKQWLLKEQKKIKQIIPHSRLVYKAEFPGAIELVSKWIHEELLYIEGIHASNPEQISYERITETDGLKLTTSLNVPQLALFAALLVEEGIIQETNKTQVFSAFSQVFKTKHQASIAVTSLRNNYYDKDPKNMSILKTKLIQMVNRLNVNLNSNENF